MYFLRFVDVATLCTLPMCIPQMIPRVNGCKRALAAGLFAILIAERAFEAGFFATLIAIVLRRTFALATIIEVRSCES